MIDLDRRNEKIRIFDHITRISQMWQSRDRQIIQDREILSLKEEPEKPGFIKVTLNEPKVLYDTAVALMSSAQPRFRLPVAFDVSELERRKMNKAERFLIGVMREINDRQVRRGGDDWLRELVYWVCSGYYAIFPLVIVKNKRVEFRADFYDPITCYPEWGHDGLVRFVRKYDTTGAYLISMCQSEGWMVPSFLEAADTVTIYNFWEQQGDKVLNAVLCSAGDDNDFLKFSTIEPFDAIPIQTGTVAGSPMRAYPGGPSDWAARMGDSIIANNRGVYKQLNRWVSMMMQIVMDTAYPTVLDYTETGKGKIRKEDMGAGAIIPRKIAEKLEAFKIASTPVEVNTILSLLGQTKQRGGLPDLTYGGLPFELSGFAINQLMSAVRYKLAPYLTATQNILAKVCMEILHQYKRGRFPKVKLVTTDISSKGQFFMEEFSTSDIPEVTFVEVTLPISTPVDKSQQILMAKQALTPPQLLSRETLWEDFLNVQDAEMEYSRIIDDQLQELPFIKNLAILERLNERVTRAEQAGDVAQANTLRKYIMFLEMQLGMRKGIPITPEEAETPGVPPEVLPPEFGYPSPDQIRSMYGVPPPKTPPRGIVSPTGEELL